MKRDQVFWKNRTNGSPGYFTFKQREKMAKFRLHIFRPPLKSEFNLRSKQISLVMWQVAFGVLTNHLIQI